MTCVGVDCINRKNSPLSCRVENGELVIRIGIDTLAFAAGHSDLFNPFNEDLNNFVQRWKVIESQGFAEDVARELKREDESGGSPLIYLIENTFDKVLDDGSLNVWSSEDEE